MSKLVTSAAAFLAIAAAPLPPGTPAAALKGDAVAGKAAFAVCRTCHVVAAGQNRIGPSLHAIVGQKAGAVPGYTYSAALRNSGIVWTEPALNQFLLAPQLHVPGTKMTYPGLKDSRKRADIIAYLKSNPLS